MAERKADEIDLFHLSKGWGEPLILLHSGGGSTAEWEACLPLFTPFYQTVTYDRRGYGRPSRPRDFTGDYFSEDVEDLKGLLDHLDISGPVRLCGFSDGGTVAMLFAANYPGRVAAMVCEGAHAYVEDITIESLSEVAAGYEKKAREEGRGEDPGVRSQLAWFRRWLEPDFRSWSILEDLSRIECPTLIVQGVRDRFATSEQAENIAGTIRGSGLWMVEEAGHRVHERFPEEFTRRALDFFDRS